MLNNEASEVISLILQDEDEDAVSNLGPPIPSPPPTPVFRKEILSILAEEMIFIYYDPDHPRENCGVFWSSSRLGTLSFRQEIRG